MVVERTWHHVVQDQSIGLKFTGSSGWIRATRGPEYPRRYGPVAPDAVRLRQVHGPTLARRSSVPHRDRRTMPDTPRVNRRTKIHWNAGFLQPAGQHSRAATDRSCESLQQKPRQRASFEHGVAPDGPTPTWDTPHNSPPRSIPRDRGADGPGASGRASTHRARCGHHRSL
jgi:hypothetical protein